jgi:osmotically-inducible protein OsmY
MLTCINSRAPRVDDGQVAPPSTRYREPDLIPAELHMKTDRQLQNDVIEELQWDAAVDATRIGVECSEGVITLSGQVESFAEKFAAEDAARRVAGVRGVAMDLEVRLPGSSKRTDADVAKAALSALDWNASVPAGAIQVKVEDGFVSLTGEVDWEYQRDAALSSVRHLLGVRGINNAVTLRPRTMVKDVKGQIEASLQRLAHQDTKAIKVGVTDSTVTLSGTARSYLERETIEAAAWNAPGVQRVLDHITVAP